jgi:hypothetical protein
VALGGKMPIKRYRTLSKGKKKTVTANQLRKKWAKGAPKRKAKKLRDEQVFAKKMRAAKKVKKPRG